MNTTVTIPVQIQRTNIEAKLRKYFVDINKFSYLPMAYTLDNLVDFVIWLESNKQIKK